MRFIIIATGYNCKPFVNKCLKSVLNQYYKNYLAIFISDGSTDGTLTHPSCTEGINDGRFIAEVYSENKGAAKRRWDAIKKYATDPEDIILLLGMDDELMFGTLKRIAIEYDRGKWMTYGNWQNQFKKMLPKGFLNFDAQTHEQRNYRQVQYRSTAPNTFKRFLFDELTEEDFKIDGKWIDTTTESPLMFACLEMCGEKRIGVINDPIYKYNEGLSNGTLKRLGIDYKYKILEIIKSRPKKPLLIR